MICIRRSGEQGAVELPGKRFAVDGQWRQRLIRCEVDLDHDRIHFFALSRRRPSEQPKLQEVVHHVPK